MAAEKETITVKDQQIFEMERYPRAVVVRVLPRRVFLDLADRFREELLRLAGDGEEALILDLSAVNVMNSTALGALIVTNDLMKKSGRPFFIAAPGRMLSEVLQRMRLDLLLPIVQSVEQAYAEVCRAYQSGAPVSSEREGETARHQEEHRGSAPRSE